MVVLITGGTGSLGQALVRSLLDAPEDWTIRVFSRDEQKQDRMKREVRSDRVRYLLGDVRDLERVRKAIRGVDYVIHAAALKIIPASEYNPSETIKTNILGSHNVIEAAIEAGVKSVVCVSSDKAVAPVNLYGYTKACMEKLAVLADQSSGKTAVNVVRYGNVIGSRGSILTILKEQAERGHLAITHPDMTRFWITLPQSCELVYRAMRLTEGGGIFIPKLRSCLVLDLCTALYPNTPVVFTGMRNGEKMHEWLSNDYEVLEDCGWAYRVDSDKWTPGYSPICSKDTVVEAQDLIESEDFAREIRAAV